MTNVKGDAVLHNTGLDRNHAAALQHLLKTASECELPFVCIDSEVRVLGPLLGSGLDPELAAEIRHFRREHAETPYLFSPFHEEMEHGLKLDERSYHLLAYRGDELLGVLRATPKPFEASYLSAELEAATEAYPNHMEISRMILSREGRARWAGMVLCFAAVQWGMTTSHAGLIALCRPQNAGRFSFLGFRQRGDGAFIIPEREGGKYRLMASTWQEIAACLEKTFGPKLIAALVPPHEGEQRQERA